MQLHSTGYKTTVGFKDKPLFSFKPEAITKDGYVLITKADLIDIYNQLPRVSLDKDL